MHPEIPALLLAFAANWTAGATLSPPTIQAATTPRSAVELFFAAVQQEDAAAARALWAEDLDVPDRQQYVSELVDAYVRECIAERRLERAIAARFPHDIFVRPS